MNESFKKLLSIEKDESTFVLDKFKEYGITELLDNEDDGFKNISINGKMMFVLSVKFGKSQENNFRILIAREISEESNSEINLFKKGFCSMNEILGNAYNGVVLVNKEGKIVKWNFENLFGLKEEEVIGKPIENVIEDTRLHIVLKTGTEELYDVQNIQGHDMITSRIPLKEDGKVVGAIGTVTYKDIKEVDNSEIKRKIYENQKKRNSGNEIYSANYTFDDIITQNQKMLELKALAQKAAISASTILIQGDSGTGKEYFAHAIHAASNRKDGPFIKINCAAIPHELIESEIFGYESGAFTGAKKEGRIGKLELANGGTLLLDEISSMTLEMQAKLLRVIEDRVFERIGGNKGIKTDIRIIACSNVDLKKLAIDGLFRKDLYFRLNVVEIYLPNLKNRIDDIEVLSENILNYQLQKVGLPSKSLTRRAISLLKLYEWPGNVRELRNVLERAANISSDNTIDIKDLPDYISNKLILNSISKKNKALKDKVAETEIAAIINALKSTNGSRTEAAKILGIHRTALYKKLDIYGIDISIF
jgi:PAS domain S-box-containing protein